ncbi:MAG: amidohydrolase family protein [Alphaproteobacteria bacterium]|nr:amidohydrolase family protein [Alphaproteobacteria bacterium]
MTKRIRCGRLFSGIENETRKDQTIVVDDGGVITYVGPTNEAPPRGSREVSIDHSKQFVMPGLIDAHTHLTFGGTQTLEDIDLYAPLEFRALRALIWGQRLLQAGFTGVIDPGCTGRTMISVRDAINSGMFEGPRVCASGPFIGNYQGYTAFYPTWINNPTAVYAHVDSIDRGIEIVRSFAKDGVDFFKFALDGSALDGKGGLASSMRPDETKALFGEAHRLGKRVIAHSKGRDGAETAAKAGADVIYHFSWQDDASLEAVIANKVTICPSLVIIHNRYAYTQPTDGHGMGASTAGRLRDPRHPEWDGHGARSDLGRSEWRGAIAAAKKAYQAGVPIMVGSDSGFAVCPVGEWNALELVLLHKYVGMTTADVLKGATSVNAKFMPGGDKFGVLEKGRFADILAVDGDPLTAIDVLLDKSKLTVYKAGERIKSMPPAINYRKEQDFSYRMWQDVYDQRFVKALGEASRLQAFAAE